MEPGILRFDLARDKSDPNAIHVYAVYEDEAAYAFHRQQPYYEELMESTVIMARSSSPVRRSSASSAEISALIRPRRAPALCEEAVHVGGQAGERGLDARPLLGDARAERNDRSVDQAWKRSKWPSGTPSSAPITRTG